MIAQAVLTSADILSYWPIIGGLVTIVGISAVTLHKVTDIQTWVQHHRHADDGSVYLPAGSRGGK
jgi:hypothetical protein